MITFSNILRTFIYCVLYVKWFARRHFFTWGKAQWWHHFFPTLLNSELNTSIHILKITPFDRVKQQKHEDRSMY